MLALEHSLPEKSCYMLINEDAQRLFESTYFTKENEHYWSTNITYAGKSLNVYSILHLRNELIKFITDKVYETLSSTYPDVPHKVMKVCILCTNVNKACLLTPLDAKEIIYSGIIDDKFIEATKFIPSQVYREEICKVLESILQNDLRYTSLIARGLLSSFISYHDIVGHRLIRQLTTDPIIDELSFSERMQRNQSLNTHFMFGRLLSPMFKEFYTKQLDRNAIHANMTSRLSLYLKGSLPLTDSKGITHSLECPIDSEESMYGLRGHAGETTVSHYAPLLYTRYRPDNVYSIDVKDKYLSDADIYSKLVRMATRRRNSVYQDSFYIRDEVIQSAFAGVENTR